MCIYAVCCTVCIYIHTDIHHRHRRNKLDWTIHIDIYIYIQQQSPLSPCPIPRALLLFLAPIIRVFVICIQRRYKNIYPERQRHQQGRHGHHTTAVTSATHNVIRHSNGGGSLKHANQEHPLPFHTHVKPIWRKLFAYVYIDGSSRLSFSFSFSFAFYLYLCPSPFVHYIPFCIGASLYILLQLATSNL